MKKYYKLTGFFFIILGLVSIILLSAKGFHFYEFENESITLLVFPAIAFPAIGIRLLKKNK
ncbi:hypothetical protein [Carboxylicivirga linearis]|uniref:DUF3098 domain-containing protein n=1 Tax=Carboxylicivirga linearis TaxID=1628157 RepID=A0ABS5K1J3_9BACT|nr:hypothetical protein [Carboxylicivirga linearis]MBS2101028.1 hypothetical protein [Carboxylicivirga linearis]